MVGIFTYAMIAAMSQVSEVSAEERTCLIQTSPIAHDVAIQRVYSASVWQAVKALALSDELNLQYWTECTGN